VSNYTHLHFRVTLEQKRFFRSRAKAAGVTLGQLIRQVLQEWIEARDWKVVTKTLQDKDQELTQRLELHRDVLVLTRRNYQLSKIFKDEWYARVSWWAWLKNLFSKPTLTTKTN